MGCGLCEQHCPIFDTAAIVVYRFGEHRLSEGNYASKWQKESILEQRRKSDSMHLDSHTESGEMTVFQNQLRMNSGSGFSDGFTD